jgi:hypothetical protein
MARRRNPYILEILNHLTARDLRILGHVAQRRVLTTRQLGCLEFGSESRARHRLVILYRLGLLHRFRPRVPDGQGSAQHCYVLSRFGAELLAVYRDATLSELGYRHDRIVRLAASQKLAHRIGVNDIFCGLAAVARREPASELQLWWTEEECADPFEKYVRPDGLGRWQEQGQLVEFFLEYDTGTETLGRVHAKLPGYERLRVDTPFTTPLLIWTSSPTREANLNQLLRGSSVRVFTSSPRAVARCPDRGPAGPIWLPTTPGMQRLPLIDLAAPDQPPGSSR